MSGTSKVFTGSLGGCGVGGGCYYSYQQMQPTNLGERLRWEGELVLDVEGNNSDWEWELLIGEHIDLTRTDSRGDGSPVRKLGLDNNVITEFKKEHIPRIKQECSSLFAESLPEDWEEWYSTDEHSFKSRLEKARDWCTQGSKILDSARKKWMESSRTIAGDSLA